MKKFNLIFAALLSLLFIAGPVLAVTGDLNLWHFVSPSEIRTSVGIISTSIPYLVTTTPNSFVTTNASGTLIFGVPTTAQGFTTTTINGAAGLVFNLIGDGVTITSTVSGATTTYSLINTGNWAGTWQGVNSTTFYLASNPAGYITSSALGPYLTTTTAAATYPTFTYASSTYYFASNPAGYITSSSLPQGFTTTTINDVTGLSFHLVGDNTTISTTYSGSTTTYSLINTGNWAGTWQGINTTSVALLSANNTFTGQNTFSATSTFATTTISRLTVSGISSLGTIAAGLWNGTAIGNVYGGTGIDSSALTGWARIDSGTWSASSTPHFVSSSLPSDVAYTDVQQTFTSPNTFSATTTLATTTITKLTVSGTSSLGTIATGLWNGTAISNVYGGTGQDSSGWTGFAVVTGGVWSASSTPTIPTSSLPSNIAYIDAANVFTVTNTFKTTTILGPSSTYYLTYDASAAAHPGLEMQYAPGTTNFQGLILGPRPIASGYITTLLSNMNDDGLDTTSTYLVFVDPNGSNNFASLSLSSDNTTTLFSSGGIRLFSNNTAITGGLTVANNAALNGAANTSAGSFTVASGVLDAEGTFKSANTSTFSALSPFAIPYIGANSVLSMNLNGLYWDYNNNRIGIGTGSPSSTIHVVQTVGTSGVPQTAIFQPATNTGIATSTEAIQFQIGTSTQKWHKGNLTTERYAYIGALTLDRDGTGSAPQLDDVSGLTVDSPTQVTTTNHTWNVRRNYAITAGSDAIVGTNLLNGIGAIKANASTLSINGNTAASRIAQVYIDQLTTLGLSGAAFPETLNDPAGLRVEGAVLIASSSFTNATNNHGILIVSKDVGASTTNSYGITDNAMTGATNNYAAQFMGGNVGIGTATPAFLLDVFGTLNVSGTSTLATTTISRALKYSNAPIANAVLTSDASGNATWIAPTTSGYVLPGTVQWSPLELGPTSSYNGNTGNFTVGTKFIMRRPNKTMTGIKFYWPNSTTSIALVSLWDSLAGTRVASGTIALSVTGTYSVSFNSPYVVPANKEYIASVYVSSSFYTAFNAVPLLDEPTAPWFGGDYFDWLSIKLFSAGDAKPASNAASEKYPVEPIFQ